MSNGYSVSEHSLAESHIEELSSENWYTAADVQLLAVERLSGLVEMTGIVPEDIRVGDKLLLLGLDVQHAAFGLGSV